MRRAAILGGVAVLASLLLSASPDSLAVGGLGDNPHVKDDACPVCHGATTTPGAPPGPVANVVTLCRSCHPTADMHPVGMIPKNITVAAGWPLDNGAVACATCHANPTCDATRSRTTPYLRGGTPERRMDFCYRCHEPTKLVRSNPHQTSPTAGSNDGTCAACHSGQPVEGARVEDSHLRLASDKVCATCHKGPIHAGALEHVGATQAKAIPPEQAKSLPLLEGGTIGCWTCHNVHEIHDNPKMLALPSDDGSLCRACHGNGP